MRLSHRGVYAPEHYDISSGTRLSHHVYSAPPIAMVSIRIRNPSSFDDY